MTSFFSSLAAGLGLGSGASAGYTLANHYIQPPRSTPISTHAVGNSTLTVMQLDAWGAPPRWELYAIWDGQSDLVGKFTSFPELQAGIQCFNVYIQGGGNRDHFWAMVNAPEGTEIPDPRPIDYPEELT